MYHYPNYLSYIHITLSLPSSLPLALTNWIITIITFRKIPIRNVILEEGKILKFLLYVFFSLFLHTHLILIRFAPEISNVIPRLRGQWFDSPLFPAIRSLKLRKISILIFLVNDRVYIQSEIKREREIGKSNQHLRERVHT